MKTTQRICAIALVLVISFLLTGCVAQQADVVRMKRDLDARITKLDKSKVALQKAVEEANRALGEANSIISTQRAEIKELLVARAEVMDQVTTIKDGDLSEVRGAIDQSEHNLRSVTQRIEALDKNMTRTQEENKASEESVRSEVEQLQAQIQQQNKILTTQAQKLSEFQASFVDFREVLNTVRQTLVTQESKFVEMDARILNVSQQQVGNKNVAQENWAQIKQSVDSVVSAFEQVSQTLANRVDEHERKLAQVVPSGSDPFPRKVSNSIPQSHVGQASVQELQESVSNLASSRDRATTKSSTHVEINPAEPVRGYTMPQHSVDRLDRSKIVSNHSSSVLRKPQSSKPNSREMSFYQKNYEMLRAGDLTGALQGFRQFLKQHPRSSLASNAQYWLGECYYGQRQYSQAIREFERVLTYYSTSNKVPAALLKIGYSHLGLQDPQTARSMFRQLVRSYPKSRAAAKAYARLTEVDQPRKEAS